MKLLNRSRKTESAPDPESEQKATDAMPKPTNQPVETSSIATAGTWPDGGIKRIFYSLVTWHWTKTLLYWLIISSGTISELAFLIASIWMSINATEHTFVLMFLNARQTDFISYLAKTSYVVLPVTILPLALITTFKHLRMMRYEKTIFSPSALWFLLYGTPALTFLSLDILIVGNSYSINYVLPTILIQLRSIMAYSYGLVAIIYHYIGQPQEVDRLLEKDHTIAALQQENATVAQKQSEEMARITAEKNTAFAEVKQALEAQHQEVIESLTQQLEKAHAEMLKMKKRSTDNEKTKSHRANAAPKLTEQLEKAHAEMLEMKSRFTDNEKAKPHRANATQKLKEGALQDYSPECQKWLRSGMKSTTCEELASYTGIPEHRILAAIRTGKLKTSSRNHDLITITSLLPWLETQTLNNEQHEQNTESLPAIENAIGPMLTLIHDERPGANAQEIARKH